MVNDAGDCVAGVAVLQQSLMMLHRVILHTFHLTHPPSWESEKAPPLAAQVVEW